MTPSISEKNLALFSEAQQSSSFVFLSGFHAIKHALRFGAKILCMATSDMNKLEGFSKNLAPDFFDLYKGDVELITSAQIQSIHEHRLHWTEVWAVAERPAVDIMALLGDAHRTSPLVVLEDPKNPGNLGASIRAAAALGASGLVVIGESDPWAPRVLQGAAGLQFALPVGRVNHIDYCAGMVVVFDPEGEDITRASIPSNAIFLFGTEREGVSRESKTTPQSMKVRIPMRKGVSSLNLATSVSIALSYASFASSRSNS